MTRARRTALFTKRPRPGAVKTRLTPHLSEEQAAELALAMLDDTFDKWCDDERHELELCGAPAEDRAWFEERYGARAAVSTQRGEGLGARMAAWFEARGAEGTGVIVGSDAPHLGPSVVHDAHERLERGADLVLGPDAGGGYYLVGLRAPCPRLFAPVMSTRTVFEETVEVARGLGLSLELLPASYDVDEPEDLARLARDLAGSAAGLAPRTLRLLHDWKHV